MNNTTILEEENFDDVDTWLRVLHGIILTLLLFFGVFGNGAVMLFVAVHKSLHYRSIVVSLGLVAADLLVALEWNLLGLASTIAGEWPFGSVACNVLGTVHLCILYVRWLEAAVVTLDRFFIILSPWNYYKYSKPLQITLTVLAWVIPFVLMTPPSSIDLGMFRFRLIMSTCSIDCLGTNPCYSFYIGVFAVFVSIGGILPTILYSIMYCIGRKKRSAMKLKLGTQQTRVPVARSESDTASSCTVSSVESSGGVAAARIDSPQSFHNAKLKDYDRRALITFFIIFITLLLTQVPIFFTSGVFRNTTFFEDIPLWIHFIAMYIYLLSPVLTPIVIMRNKDFRKILARTIKRTRTMPVVTNKQIREFRRNSSFNITNDLNRSGKMDSEGSLSDSGLNNFQISHIGFAPMKTVIEEDHGLQETDCDQR